jgi:hypothetical protein
MSSHVESDMSGIEDRSALAPQFVSRHPVRFAFLVLFAYFGSAAVVDALYRVLWLGESARDVVRWAALSVFMTAFHVWYVRRRAADRERVADARSSPDNS